MSKVETPFGKLRARPELVEWGRLCESVKYVAPAIDSRWIGIFDIDCCLLYRSLRPSQRIRIRENPRNPWLNFGVSLWP